MRCHKQKCLELYGYLHFSEVMHSDWLKNSHVNCNIQTDCIISVYHRHAKIKLA